jgi:hypothetical protein
MKQKKLDIYENINKDQVFKAFIKKCIIGKSYEDFMKLIVLEMAG